MNWHTLAAIDADKWATQTYRANFPGVDVRQGMVGDFIDTLPDADVILAGPPCQPHSHAGKRQSSSDARDGGPDFVAAVAKVKPRMFLMENVAGLVTSEGGAYFQRLYKALGDCGYVLDYRVQDAVSFGVPQFRERLWVWGIQRDLYVDGIRHAFPVPTHAWPPPLPGFWEMPLPGVTVGQALGLDGMIHRVRGQGMLERDGSDREDSSTAEPCPTIGAGSKGSGPRLEFIQLQSHADAPVGIDRPAPALRSGGAGHDGCCVRIIGGGYNPPAGRAELRTVRDITNEPSTTMGTGSGNALPEVVAYRWSDAMLEKHPPASPASPASTVQAKWFKGGAEGLLEVDTKQKRTRRDVAEPSPTVAHDSRHHHLKRDGLYVRRLTPLECMRLQSAPDDFRWPDGIGKTAMYRVCGNGWASAHGAAYSRALAAVDPNARTVVDLFCGGGLGAVGWHQRFWSYRPAMEVVA